MSVNVKQLSESSVRGTLSSSARPSQEAVSASTDEERLAKIHNVIQQLPPPHYRSVSGSPALPAGRLWNVYSSSGDTSYSMTILHYLVSTLQHFLCLVCRCFLKFTLRGEALRAVTPCCQQKPVINIEDNRMAHLTG